MSNALEFANIGTTEWYNIADGFGFVINTSYRYPKLITDTKRINIRSRTWNLRVVKASIIITSNAPKMAA